MLQRGLSAIAEHLFSSSSEVQNTLSFLYCYIVTMFVCFVFFVCICGSSNFVWAYRLSVCLSICLILAQTFLCPYTHCFSYHVYPLVCWPAFCHAVIKEYWLIDWLIDWLIVSIDTVLCVLQLSIYYFCTYLRDQLRWAYLLFLVARRRAL